jgi:ABC-type molybdate transport system substrate-binding protein
VHAAESGQAGVVVRGGGGGFGARQPWLRSYVVIYCDPTLKPVLRRVGEGFTAKTGAPVSVFAGPPSVNLGLLAHATQNDLLISTAETTRAAAAAGVLAPGPVGTPLWHNRLVIAGARGDAAGLSTIDAPALVSRLGDGKFALTDATPAATIDGPAIIGALGLTAALADRIVPAVSTDEIGFLIHSGAARLGLCHRTDVRTDAGLAEVAAVPDAGYPPISYCVSRTAKAWSAIIDAFEAYLSSPEATAMLGGLGLERA